jgi:hypothetical protein
MRSRNWFKPQNEFKQSSGESYQGLGVFNEQVREIDLAETQVEQRFRANLYSHWLYQHSGERAFSTSVTLYVQPDLVDFINEKALRQAQASIPLSEHLHFQWKL